MTMPGFTAEASLPKTKRSYVLASRVATEAGKVLAQALFVNRYSHLIYCDDLVGCVDLGYRGPVYAM